MISQQNHNRVAVSDRMAGGDEPAIGILFENAEWLSGLFDRLAERELPFAALSLDDAAMSLDDAIALPLLFNRVSPSSYLRDHQPAIAYVHGLLRYATTLQKRVINGGRSFELETSKVAQHMLFRTLGIATPRTVLFNGRRGVRDLANSVHYPAMIKPDCGGSGAFVKRVNSAAELIDLLDSRVDLFAPDHLLLLQEYIKPADGTVVRMEFIDGELVYAMRVRPTNTFNLCPADTCDRQYADPDQPEQPQVVFEPYPDIPPDAVAQAREVVREAQLDVGGVEYIEDEHGIRWFIDINATSVYRDDISEAFDVDALGMLVDFLQRELHKEHLKQQYARHQAIARNNGISATTSNGTQ